MRQMKLPSCTTGLLLAGGVIAMTSCAGKTGPVSVGVNEGRLSAVVPLGDDKDSASATATPAPPREPRDFTSYDRGNRPQ